MTPIFRICLLIASLGIVWLIMSGIRKAKMNIDDSLFWLILSLVFVLFAVFPAIPDTLAHLFGVYSTSNFLFAFFIALLVLKVFMMSKHISLLESKIRELTQGLALLDHDVRNNDASDVSCQK